MTKAYIRKINNLYKLFDSPYPRTYIISLYKSDRAPTDAK